MKKLKIIILILIIAFVSISNLFALAVKRDTSYSFGDLGSSYNRASLGLNFPGLRKLEKKDKRK